MFSKLLPVILLIGCCSFPDHGLWAQSDGDYQSAASGDWKDNDTWQIFKEGTWVSLANNEAKPSSASGAISIRSGHTVTISNASSPSDVDELTIETGGQLTVGNNRTLQLLDNTSGADLIVNGILSIVSNAAMASTEGAQVVVNGTILNSGDIALTGLSASLTFNEGSNYAHTQNGGTIPPASWSAKSNCLLTGITGTAPEGLGQSFGNLIINSTNLDGPLAFGDPALGLQGNLEIQSTGGGRLNFNQDKLTIGADLILSGGILNLASSNISRTFDVVANFAMSGGSFTISDGTAPGVLNVAGNFTHTAGTISHSGSTGTIPSEINFNGSGLQTFTGGGAYSGLIDFNVQNGATLTFGNVDFVDFSKSTGDFTNFGTLMGNFPEPDESDGDLEGIVLADGKALMNEGTVAPGNSVGTLVIIGDFISIGTLNMEIEGETTFDRIIVTGDADVSGTLAPEFTMMYTPDMNDDFGLITAATYSGAISTLSVTPADFDCTYTDNGGILEFLKILPIDLLSFTGQRMELGILLNWRTATEVNNDYMAVERAGQDLRFVEIGRVSGVGTTTEPQAYEFLDESPLEGANYYRLRQVDLDGSVNYHSVIYVDFIAASQASSLQLFPNPARDRVRAAWQAGDDQPAQLRLFDTSGRQLRHFRVNGKNGTYELPVNDLAPGTYYLQLQQGSKMEKTPFVKH